VARRLERPRAPPSESSDGHALSNSAPCRPQARVPGRTCGRCGREHDLRSDSAGPRASISWSEAASVTRLKTPMLTQGNQNAGPEDARMNRSGRVPPSPQHLRRASSGVLSTGAIAAGDDRSGRHRRVGARTAGRRRLQSEERRSAALQTVNPGPWVRVRQIGRRPIGVAGDTTPSDFVRGQGPYRLVTYAAVLLTVSASICRRSC